MEPRRREDRGGRADAVAHGRLAAARERADPPVAVGPHRWRRGVDLPDPAVIEVGDVQRPVGRDGDVHRAVELRARRGALAVAAVRERGGRVSTDTGRGSSIHIAENTEDRMV